MMVSGRLVWAEDGALWSVLFYDGELSLMTVYSGVDCGVDGEWFLIAGWRSLNWAGGFL